MRGWAPPDEPFRGQRVAVDCTIFVRRETFNTPSVWTGRDTASVSRRDLAGPCACRAAFERLEEEKVLGKIVSSPVLVVSAALDPDDVAEV